MKKLTLYQFDKNNKEYITLNIGDPTQPHTSTKFNVCIKELINYIGDIRYIKTTIIKTNKKNFEEIIIREVQEDAISNKIHHLSALLTKPYKKSNKKINFKIPFIVNNWNQSNKLFKTYKLLQSLDVIDCKINPYKLEKSIEVNCDKDNYIGSWDFSWLNKEFPYIKPSIKDNRYVIFKIIPMSKKR